MSRTTLQRNRARGFTLLELLVSLVVMSLIMAASFGAIRVGYRVLESGIENAGNTDRTRTAVNLLRRQFSQVIPVMRNIEGESVAAFSGDSAAVRFVAPALQSDLDSGLYLYVLRSEPHSDGASLGLSYAPYDPGAPAFVVDEWHHYTLFVNGDKFDFAYFGTAESGSSRGWHDDWDSSRQSLPELVRISAVSSAMQMNLPTLIFNIFADYQQ